MNLGQIIRSLEDFWLKEGGCVLMQSHDVEVGAGTLSPATAIETLKNDVWNVCYAQYSRRPTDGRYAENPNRLSAYYQFQVILKPFPENAQELYLRSLAAFGITRATHDIRFLEDNWENPSIGAAGLGFEVWINGMECTQWTYMQQIGGIEFEKTGARNIPCEITYGVERLAMYIQNKNDIFDIVLNDAGVTYGDVFREREVQFSKFYKEEADAPKLEQDFLNSERLSAELSGKGLYYPAYEEALKASAVLNILDARGAISQFERANYILRVRTLVKTALSKAIGL